jgi:multidrug efflux system outer membrane protein
MARLDLRPPILVVLACLLVGCSLIPEYRRPDLPVAQTFPSDSPANNGCTQCDLPLWEAFVTDERLKRLIALALANNRDLRVAALNVAQSEAQYRISRAQLYPSVDASASATRQKISADNNLGFGSFGNSGALPGVSLGSSTSNAFSANLATSSYEIDFFGRIRSLNQQALEQYFSTEEARRNSQIALIAEVSIQYFTSLQAEQQIELATRTLGSVLESYQVNLAKFNAGEANELDLRTAEGQVQTARLNLLNYQRELQVSDDALVLLLGGPQPNDLPPARPFDDVDRLADTPAGLPSDLIERRPDILAAEHTLKAANANIGAARAAYFPSITLTGSVGSSSSQLSQLFGSGTGAWSFSPQISLPIFTGGKNDANLEAARVAVQIDVASYEKTIQTAFKEVADALWSIESYRGQIVEGNKLVTAQQRRLELATLRYRFGEDSYLNVTLAQQDLYNAQQNVLNAKLNKLSSQISLYQALGAGWQ